MRLTLRTLLAYVDDILDASDQEELRKKVEGSEFATDLLHRTRDTMRRLRLGAPPVLGGEGNLDPNTVAEYLDNSLSPEQVGDFERICLESDVHLAEVGSCHQILTMVLGEPAEIDPETRQRIYQVSKLSPKAAEPPVAQPVAVPDAQVETLPQAELISEPPQVPDYLRQTFMQRHRRKLALAAVLALVAVGIFIWRSPNETDLSKLSDEMGITDMNPSVIEEEPDSVEDADSERSADSSGTPLAGSSESEPPRFQNELPGEDPANLGPGDSAAGVPPDDLPVPDQSQTAQESVPLPAPSTDETESPAPGPGVDSPATSLPPEPNRDVTAPPPPEPDPTTDASPVADGTSPPPSHAEAGVSGDVPSDGTADVVVPEGQDPSQSPVRATVPDGNAIPQPDAHSGEPAAPALLATYGAGRDILLRYDPTSKEWIRLAPRSKLFAGDLLLAVPAFRPKVAFMSGIQVQLDGGTRVVLIDSGEPASGDAEGGQSGLEIIYGRLVVDSTLLNPATLRLKIGAETARVQFEGASTLAIDVHRDLPSGADPMTGPAIVTADFYATSGHLVWFQGPDGIEITPPSQWKWSETSSSPPEALESLEGLEWIDGVMPTNTDLLALPKLLDALEPDQPVSLRLSELTGDRHREIQSLVGRTSVHVGQFGSFVTTLNDSDQRAVWDEHISTLKTALALSPEMATEVRDSFRRQKGEARGDELFRMLWGYSDEDIRQGILANLVEKLDDESLDCRVLAFYNLQQLTGKGFGYRPADREKTRQRAIRTWRERLASNELLPK